MYGVYICNTSTLASMQENGLSVEVLDLGAAFTTRTTTIDELYEKIIRGFTDFVCFVYIKGLPMVEDLLLKWCCEYTQRCPWRFIYFENTDSTHNFSENRDRCNNSLYTKPSLEEWLLNQYGNTDIHNTEYRYKTASTKCSEILSSCFPELAETPILSQCQSHWEEYLEGKYFSSEQIVAFVESPPGAGKTHLMEAIMAKERNRAVRKCVRVDCSNDELVERAMEGVLSSKFPNDSLALLVADEFHMLSEDHKVQLFAWISSRLSWLKVFIIANRSNDFDDKLLGTLKEQNSSQSVHKVVCHLEIPKILEVFQHRDAKVMKFLEMWHIASRTLFGDESISLRHVKKLQDIMEINSSPPNLALSTFFQSKMPSLGSFMCDQFVNTLLYFFKVTKREESSSSSAIQLLVKTSLLPYFHKSPQNFASYPEFVRMLRGSMKVHPVLRLVAWVQCMHSAFGKPVPLLDPLLQLKVIDQTGFPLVLDVTPSATSLRSCDAFTQKGDYSNLKWIHDTLTHGYAINWKDVQAYWKLHFITNPRQFEELLSVCPNPAVSLQAVDSKNLVALIENGSHRFAKTVVEFYDLDSAPHSLEENNPNSPYYAAAWFLLRQQELPCSTDLLDELDLDTSKVLLWASRFAYHALSVTDNYLERTKFLQQILVECTTELVEKIDQLRAQGHASGVASVETQIITLWSHIFAPLLRVGTKHSGVPHYATLLLASHQYPPKSEWPELVKHLSSVIYGKAEKSHVEELLCTDFFYRLNERTPADPDQFAFPTGKVGTKLVTGLLTISPSGAVLSRQWQIHLLTTPGVVIPELFATAKGLAQLELGLATLRSTSELRIAHGKVRDMLEGHRVFANQSSSSAGFTKDQQILAISKAERKQNKHFMRFLKSVCEKDAILEYYNTYVGANWREVETSDIEKFKMDEYNNPAGDKFDLGKNGAFTKFRIIVGNFFHITKEFDMGMFRKYAQSALEQKGFRVDVVQSEEEFIRQMQNYDQAWVISSSVADATTRKFNGTEKWRVLADACERFYNSGRGIFIFADNQPYYAHANVILHRFFGILLEGSTDACNTLTAATANPPIVGTFLDSHLIGSGLQTLYEGSTICYPNNSIRTMESKGLFTFAQSTDNYPAVLFAQNKVGGRVVVDTGFTKLWLNWNSAGTARYICNATVWLLAIEHRLNNNYPVQGTLVENPYTTASLYDPSIAEVSSRDSKVRLDIQVVLHNANNLSQPDFQKLKSTVSMLAGLTVELDVSYFGLIHFANIAKDHIDCTSILPVIKNRMKKLTPSKLPGCNLLAGLTLGYKKLLQRNITHNGIRALVLVVTEQDSAPHQEKLKSLVDNIKRSGFRIYIVAVGAGAQPSLAAITDSSNTFVCNFNNVTASASRIADKLKGKK